MFRTWLLAACFALLLATPPARAQVFEGLGFFGAAPDVQRSDVGDVSGDGKVIVGWASGAGAFRWENGSYTLLPFAYPQYPYAAIAFGISRDGTTIVGFTSGSRPEQQRAATRWRGGSAADIGPLVTSEALATSADGAVIVGTAGPHSFRYVEGEGVQIFQIGSQSRIRGVSDDGSMMIGYVYDPFEKGVLWKNGERELLPGFAGDNEDDAREAYDISGDGTIIVGSARRPTGRQMVRWVNGVIEELGALGRARSTSADGRVIVGDTRTADPRALIWTPTRGVEDLKTHLQVQYGLDLTGWTLLEAVAVSADGGTVVGNGRNPQGKLEAWRATLRSSDEHVVNRDDDAADANVDNKLCDVDANQPGLQCTLRAAIQEVNAGHGTRIVFDIPGAGVPRITLQSALPAISKPVQIDGTTQSGGRVEVRGIANVDGLQLAGGKSVVRGLVLNGFTRTGSSGGSAILITGAGGNSVVGNYIGTTADGNAALANRRGVVIDGSPDNTIGGTGADANVISGNEGGVVIGNAGANANRVLGNRIGLAANGGFVRNDAGVAVLGGSGNVVGGATPNRIASKFYDVVVSTATGNVAGTEVLANFLGLDATGGSAGTPDERYVGVVVNSDGERTVTGTRVVDNRIAGQAIGVWVFGAGATDTRVAGNRIGLAFDESGVLPAGAHSTAQTTGIRVDASPAVIVSANLVAGFGHGVLAAGSAQYETKVVNGETEYVPYGPDAPLGTDPGTGNDVNISGNTIGLNASGAVPGGATQKYGVTIFGGARGARVVDNTIAGFSGADVLLLDAAQATVTGNRLGTTDGADHRSAIGVRIDAVTGATIGGDADAARNLISRHTDAGVVVEGQSSDISIVGNYIGTDTAGTAAWPNATGIRVDALIDGIAGLRIRRNVIGGSTVAGIVLDNSVLTEVVENRIGIAPAGTPVANEIGLLLADGPARVEGNYFAFNDGAAIRVEGTAPATLTMNYVYENGAGIAYATAPFAAPEFVYAMRSDPSDTGRVGMFIAIPATGAPGEVTLEIFGNRNCTEPQGRVPLLSRKVPGNAPFVEFFAADSLQSFGTLDGYTATVTRGAATSAYSPCGTVRPFADGDDDGSSDLFELLAGDRNADGQADVDQRNVATHLASPPSGTPQFVTIVSAPGTTVQQSSVTVTNLPPIDGVTYTVGLIGFDIQGVPSGAQTTVDIVLESGRPADALRYIKVPRIESASYRFMPESGTGDRAERTNTGWRLYLTDGGEWDADGAANGRIRDPGGPVMSNVAPAPAPTPVPPVVVTASPRGGGGALDAFALLGLLLLALSRLRRQAARH